MPFCPQCGTEIKPHYSFCKKCGIPVSIPEDLLTPEDLITPEDEVQTEAAVAADVPTVEEPVVDVESEPAVQEEPAQPIPEDNTAPVDEEAPEEEVSEDEYPDLQSLSDKANAGDARAMYLLGVYYKQLDNEQEIDGKNPGLISREWLERSVIAGYAGAVAAVCAHYDMIVMLSEMTYDDIGDPNLIQEKLDACQWYARGLGLIRDKAPGSELIDIDKFMDFADDARYSLAVSLHEAKNDDDALKLISQSKRTPSVILRSLIQYDRVEEKLKECYETENFTDFAYYDELTEEKKQLADSLAVIVDNDEYGNASRLFSEEKLYCRAAVYLAFYYKDEHQFKNARYVLTYVGSYMRDSRLKEMLLNEAERYVTIANGDLVYKSPDGKFLRE